MATRQIERSHWKQFLNNFSRTHEGRAVTVKAFGPGTGDHHEARELPFAGFEAETAEAEGAGHIIVMLGTNKNDHVSHLVNAPVQVWHKSGPDEPDEVVELRSDDGVALVIKFLPHP